MYEKWRNAAGVLTFSSSSEAVSGSGCSWGLARVVPIRLGGSNMAVFIGKYLSSSVEYLDNKMKIKTMNDQFPIKNWNAIHTIANSEDSSTRFNIKINLLSRKVIIVWIVLRVKCILFCVKKQLRLVDLWRNIPFLNSLLMASSKTTLEILRYKCPSKPSRWFNHELLGKTRNCTHINLMIYTD